MPSALVGTFGAIVRLGMISVLRDGAVQCVGDDLPDGDLLSRLEATRPDAVVIDGDDGSSGSLAEAVRGRRPGVTVIACSNEHLTMRVLPGWADRLPYETTLSAAELVGAVRSAATR